MGAPSRPSTDRSRRGSALATIGVVVHRPPVATPDSTTVDEDGVTVVDVVADDSDPQAAVVKRSAWSISSRSRTASRQEIFLPVRSTERS